jgi:Mitochondrial ribosomal protein L51 / S25 / CI-B8 domain
MMMLDGLFAAKIVLSTCLLWLLTLHLWMLSVDPSNFVFWHLPQLKYKNPSVQMVTLKMVTPTPWIKAYFGNTLNCCNL